MQYDTQAAKVPHASTCDGCGKGGATLSPLGTHYCPACMQKQAMAFFATDQLKALLTRAAQDWVATWAAHPFILLSAVDEAGMLAEDAMQEVLDAHREVAAQAAA